MVYRAVRCLLCATYPLAMIVVDDCGVRPIISVLLWLAEPDGHQHPVAVERFG